VGAFYTDTISAGSAIRHTYRHRAHLRSKMICQRMYVRIYACDLRSKAFCSLKSEVCRGRETLFRPPWCEIGFVIVPRSLSCSVREEESELAGKHCESVNVPWSFVYNAFFALRAGASTIKGPSPAVGSFLDRQLFSSGLDALAPREKHRDWSVPVSRLCHTLPPAQKQIRYRP